jgi:hypothetical protein
VVEGSAEGRGVAGTTMRIARVLTVVVVLISASLAHESWVIRPDGVGPAKVGMSLPELNSALQEKFSVSVDGDQSCFYVNPKNHPQIAFMIAAGKFVRVDVNERGISTMEGVQVGDTQARAQQVYGVRLKVEPSRYTGNKGGRYLTERSPNGGYGIRFETEKGKITTFYAGTYAAIQYVEGCDWTE